MQSSGSRSHEQRPGTGAVLLVSTGKRRQHLRRIVGGGDQAVEHHASGCQFVECRHGYPAAPERRQQPSREPIDRHQEQRGGVGLGGGHAKGLIEPGERSLDPSLERVWSWRPGRENCRFVVPFAGP